LGTDEIGAALPGDESGPDFITIFGLTNINFGHDFATPNAALRVFGSVIHLASRHSSARQRQLL
jgi:hypothetical protein